MIVIINYYRIFALADSDSIVLTVALPIIIIGILLILVVVSMFIIVYLSLKKCKRTAELESQDNMVHNSAYGLHGSESKQDIGMTYNLVYDAPIPEPSYRPPAHADPHEGAYYDDIVI